MKPIIAPLGLSLGLALAAQAEAAPPAYCALYAREYANQFTAAAGQPKGSEQRIADEAYYRCLNLDEPPEMPPGSAYSGTEVDARAEGGPFEPLSMEATAGVPSDAAIIEPAPAKPKAASRPKRKYVGSGLLAWSPEWRAWCQAHFPNSFDEKTGTVLPTAGNGKRVFCR